MYQCNTLKVFFKNFQVMVLGEFRLKNILFLCIYADFMFLNYPAEGVIQITVLQFLNHEI